MKSLASTSSVIAIIISCLLSFFGASNAFVSVAHRQLNKHESQFRLHYLTSDDLRDEYLAHKQHRARNGDPIRVSTTKTDGGIGGILVELQNIWNNLDDVVDDFLCKRMGSGEQFYGKRKYNPSGRHDGVYNGMGRSDFIQIEVARARREEMEFRKQERLAKEQEKNSF
ncbi:MAG: hypothetical protein SGBAC_010931 [Bacillariaceae sp.]